jgi:hypothetical protein
MAAGVLSESLVSRSRSYSAGANDIVSLRKLLSECLNTKGV